MKLLIGIISSTLLLLFIGVANAQIKSIHVIKVENEDAFENMQTIILAEVGVDTGMSFTSSDSLNNVATPEEELKAEGFSLGEYIVLCFELKQPLYIRLLDTKPNGQTEQLYPANDGTVLFESGKTHCIGDRGPYFYADEASGLGKGILWFHGSTVDTSGERIAEWTIPVQGSNGTAWGSIPTLDTNTIENPDNIQEVIYEAHYRYEIK